MITLVSGIAITFSILLGVFSLDSWPIAAPILLGAGLTGILLLMAVLIDHPLRFLLLLFPVLFLRTDDRVFLLWVVLVAVVAVIEAVRPRRDIPPLDRPLLLMLGLVLCAAVLGWTRSLHPADGLLRLMTTFVAPFLVFLIIVRSPSGWNLTSLLPRLYVYCFALVGLMSLVYKLQFPESTRVSGYVQMSVTMVGYASAALVPLALHYTRERHRRGFHLVILALVLIAALLTNARMAMLMVIAAFALNWRRLSGPMLVWLAFGCIGLAYGSDAIFTRFQESNAGDMDTSTASRLIAWWTGIKLVWASPLLGIGLGNFSELYLGQTATPLIRLIHAHNALLQMAADIGLPGAFLFFGAIAHILFGRPASSDLQKALRGTLLVFLIAGATDAIFFLSNWSIWYWALLACYWRLGEPPPPPLAVSAPVPPSPLDPQQLCTPHSP